MTKLEFMRQLEARLTSIPRSEVEKTKAYFDEMIQDRMEEGSTEEEAVSAMGDPAVIAAGILNDASIPSLVRAKVEKRQKNSGNKGLLILLAIIGFPIWFPLFMVLLSVILSVYITIGAVIISIFAVLLSFIVSGIACIIFSAPAFVVLGPARGLAALGAGFCLSGIALLLFRPAVAVTRGILRFTAFVLRKIKNALVGDKRKNTTTDGGTAV